METWILLNLYYSWGKEYTNSLCNSWGSELYTIYKNEFFCNFIKFYLFLYLCIQPFMNLEYEMPPSNHKFSMKYLSLIPFYIFFYQQLYKLCLPEGFNSKFKPNFFHNAKSLFEIARHKHRNSIDYLVLKTRFKRLFKRYLIWKQKSDYYTFRIINKYRSYSPNQIWV